MNAMFLDLLARSPRASWRWTSRSRRRWSSPRPASPRSPCAARRPRRGTSPGASAWAPRWRCPS